MAAPVLVAPRSWQHGSPPCRFPRPFKKENPVRMLQEKHHKSHQKCIITCSCATTPIIFRQALTTCNNKHISYYDKNNALKLWISWIVYKRYMHVLHFPPVRPGLPGFESPLGWPGMVVRQPDQGHLGERWPTAKKTGGIHSLRVSKDAYTVDDKWWQIVLHYLLTLSQRERPAPGSLIWPHAGQRCWHFLLW